MRRRFPGSRLFRSLRLSALLVSAWLGIPHSPARADTAVSCGGYAMMGGAQLACSHVAPKQPVQVCTFSWALMTMANTPTVVDGSFAIPPGAVNTIVYQGSGFASALSNPIVLCQGKKSR